MNFALAYYIVLLIWVITEATGKPLDVKSQKSNVLLLGLLLLIGWTLFGAPLHK